MRISQHQRYVFARSQFWVLSILVACLVSSDGSASAEQSNIFHLPTEIDVAEAAADLVIADIKIEGNRLITTEEILAVVKSKNGEKYNKDQVVSDLKAIDGLGYFNKSTLQVNPKVLPDGSLLLSIHVEENPPITQFTITGNNVIETEELSKLFEDQLGRPANLNVLSSAIAKVEETYRQKGFVLAQVADVKDDPDGRVELVINEGVIDQIVISGNRKIAEFVIRRNINLKSGSVYNEKQLTSDLKKMYSNFHFLDIRRSVVPSENNPSRFTLKVEVDERRTTGRFTPQYIWQGFNVNNFIVPDFSTQGFPVLDKVRLLKLPHNIDTLLSIPVKDISGSSPEVEGVSPAAPFGSYGFTDNYYRGRGQVLHLSSQTGSSTLNGLADNVNNGGTNFLPTGKTYDAELKFIEPSLRGADVPMSDTLFGRNMALMAIDQSMQQTFGLSTNFSKPLGHGWTGNFGLTGEKTRLRDVGTLYPDQNILGSMEQRALQTGLASSSAAAASTAQSYRSQQLKGGVFSSISPSISYDTRDSVVDATRGSYVRFSTTPTASKFVPLSEGTSLLKSPPTGAALGGMPQFSQYRLGGYFDRGVRGFRSFSDLATGTQMLMGTQELRRKLHLPGDSVVNKAINNNFKPSRWLDYGQVGTSSGSGVRVNMPTVGMPLNYGLPVMGRGTVRHGQLLMGDFPKRAAGMRDGRPVSELPYIKSNSQSGFNPHTEHSWTY